MKVLIIGNGGREYSIARAMHHDAKVSKIFMAPGNGATEEIATNIPMSDFETLAQFAKQEQIDLTIVGPEAPLVEGIVDCFESHNLTIFGPSAKAAQLEGSKIFMKNFLARHNIPTARYIETDSLEAATEFINELSAPIVVKADGLCGGKGVIIAPTHQEAIDAAKDMLAGDSFGEAGTKIVVEEFLDGYELSVFAVCDGKDYIILPAAQDHKRLLDNDQGPNTGGMGAYAPTPLVNDEIYRKLNERVVEPTLKGMEAEGMPFTGILFMGVMVVDGEPLILEYNVRFGDPECEELMPLLKSSAFDLFYDGATQNLANSKVEFHEACAVGVVMASKDYPYKSSTPAQIIVDEIVDEQLAANSYIAYAGVDKDEEGNLIATGGRVSVCVGIGEDIKTARDRAYALAGQVHFAGKQCRMDIAYQALR